MYIANFFILSCIFSEFYVNIIKDITQNSINVTFFFIRKKQFSLVGRKSQHNVEGKNAMRNGFLCFILDFVSNKSWKYQKIFQNYVKVKVLLLKMHFL